MVKLETPSIRAGIDIENRTQILAQTEDSKAAMSGFSGNIPDWKNRRPNLLAFAVPPSFLIVMSRLKVVVRTAFVCFTTATINDYARQTTLLMTSKPHVVLGRSDPSDLITRTKLKFSRLKEMDDHGDSRQMPSEPKI